MELQTPQIIYLGLNIFALGVILSKHGEPETGKHNFMVSLVFQAGYVAILYWGGFFG